MEFKEPTNADRVERARETIEAYRAARRDMPDTDVTDAQDCITDMLHLIHASLIEEGAPTSEMLGILRSALMNFNAEVGEESSGSEDGPLSEAYQALLDAQGS